MKFSFLNIKSFALILSIIFFGFMLSSCAFSPHQQYTYQDFSFEGRTVMPRYSVFAWQAGLDFEIVEGDVWEQKKDLSSRRDLTQLAPISTGMTKKELYHLWGPPARIEYAGNPRLENECWIYNALNSAGRVYFEAGRIDGWAL